MHAKLLRKLVLQISVLIGVSACGLLDVSDPTAIEEEDVANPTGAGLLFNDALRRLYDTVDDHAALTGMLADEFEMYFAENSLDRRTVVSRMEELILPPNASLGFAALFEHRGGLYGMWQHVRSAAALAMHAAAGIPGSAVMTAHLMAVRGYATLSLAEGFCPGFPLNEIVGFRPVYGPPMTTDGAFARALADFDSAAVRAGDSTGVLNFARIGQGRALLGMGRFAEAGAAVSNVPTTYTRNAEYDAASPPNIVFSQANNLSQHAFFYQRRVGDMEGGNGVNFVSAQDPRAPVGLSFSVPTIGDSYAMGKYMDKPGEPIVIASGIEARLIEAEAALSVGNPNWLVILNDLRVNYITPALPALEDPGNDHARVDLLFRERALWLFGTGHRLGDLRRLVAHYGRDSEAVFPTGNYRAGGTYGVATSLFFPADVESDQNPAITGCTAN